MDSLNLYLVSESDLEHEPADQSDANRRSEMDIGNVQVGDGSLGGHHISR